MDPSQRSGVPKDSPLLTADKSLNRTVSHPSMEKQEEKTIKELERKEIINELAHSLNHS